ncbi:MAG TPA: hypothetical protein DCY07_01505 [Rhodospirillaceae bacterium]|nr:hypothetical protein [Rhodospirillaceae bacterium]
MGFLWGALLLVGTLSMPLEARAGVTDDENALSDRLPPCPDQALATSLRHAPRAAFANAVDAMQNTHADMLRADAANPKKYQKGKLIDTYCLGVYLDYFNLIRLLMTGAAKIEMAITAMLDAVFNYICEAVQTTVENVMGKLCVPIPDLGFTIELPRNRAHGSCSGDLSVADMFEVDTGTPLQTAFPIPQDFLTRPLSRWLGADGSNGRF